MAFRHPPGSIDNLIRKDISVDYFTAFPENPE